jgi:predicted transcriptional regulator
MEAEVKRFIQKNKKIEYSTILNEMNIDYDMLMQILRKLKSEGHLK